MSPSIITLLRQDLIWRGQDGRPYVVDYMDHDYRVNLLAYLRRNAARLRDHAIWYDVQSGRETEESLARSIDATSSLDWMNDQPLTRRLAQLVSRHDSIEPDTLELEGGMGTMIRTRVADGDN